MKKLSILSAVLLLPGLAFCLGPSPVLPIQPMDRAEFISLVKSRLSYDPLSNQILLPKDENLFFEAYQRVVVGELANSGPEYVPKPFYYPKDSYWAIYHINDKDYNDEWYGDKYPHVGNVLFMSSIHAMGGTGIKVRQLKKGVALKSNLVKTINQQSAGLNPPVSWEQVVNYLSNGWLLMRSGLATRDPASGEFSLPLRMYLAVSKTGLLEESALVLDFDLSYHDPRAPEIKPAAAAGADTSGAEPSGSELKKKLQDLKGLFEAGLITKDEYDQKRAELLKQL